MSYDYSQYHPKSRKGKECKKVNCKRHEAYSKWIPGSPELKFCMECRNAHISQYVKKDISLELNRERSESF